MIGPNEGAPWWLAGGAAALWIAREFYGAVLSRTKNRTETDANVELLEQLREGMRTTGERIRVLEESQAKISTRLEEEIRMRMKAQEEAHRMRLRVQTLESTLKQLGAVIPPEDHLQ